MEKHRSIAAMAVACIMAAALTVSCRRSEGMGEEKMEKHAQSMNETYVDTMTLHMTSFDKQIVCNGRLRAKAKSDLAFASPGVTMEIYVKDGQLVSKGTLIASTDKRERIREVEKAEH